MNRVSVACAGLLLSVGCGGSQATSPNNLPGTKRSLSAVDSHGIPVIIGSDGPGRAVLAVAGNINLLNGYSDRCNFTVSLQRTSGAGTGVTDSFGTVACANSGSVVTATIDLGPPIGVHSYLFSR